MMGHFSCEVGVGSGSESEPNQAVRSWRLALDPEVAHGALTDALKGVAFERFLIDILAISLLKNFLHMLKEVVAIY